MSAKHTPTEIKLHQKSQIFEIGFASGENFKLPSEYLRTHAKSAEIEAADKPVFGKADIKLEKIEQQGNYALRLYFDDGYDSGIYAWDTFYELGSNYEKNWALYLEKLAEYGLKRQLTERSGDDVINIRLMFFMTNMLKVTKKESEDISLTAKIDSVEKLLKLLRMRGEDWARMFADDAIQVTVNKQFAELFTKLEDADEVAFIPRSKDI